MWCTVPAVVTRFRRFLMTPCSGWSTSHPLQPPVRRNSPERTLDLTVRRRGGNTVHLPVKPALAPDGGGRIGVQLSANAALSRRIAAGPGQALAMASAEFRKLLGVVTTGAPRPLSRLLCWSGEAHRQGRRTRRAAGDRQCIMSALPSTQHLPLLAYAHS